MLSEAEKINVKKLEDNEETVARETLENQRGTRRMGILTTRRRTVTLHSWWWSPGQPNHM